MPTQFHLAYRITDLDAAPRVLWRHFSLAAPRGGGEPTTSGRFRLFRHTRSACVMGTPFADAATGRVGGARGADATFRRWCLALDGLGRLASGTGWRLAGPDWAARALSSGFRAGRANSGRCSSADPSGKTRSRVKGYADIAGSCARSNPGAPRAAPAVRPSAPRRA